MGQSQLAGPAMMNFGMGGEDSDTNLLEALHQTLADVLQIDPRPSSICRNPEVLFQKRFQSPLDDFQHIVSRGSGNSHKLIDSKEARRDFSGVSANGGANLQPAYANPFEILGVKACSLGQLKQQFNHFTSPPRILLAEVQVFHE